MHKKGFTLIEMSIVLVIMGLVIGGVLMGQDLIASAAIRSQISQIEKYNTAVNTFRGKYGYLPGDMISTSAIQFGFIARGGGIGDGDGNGIIENSCSGGMAFDGGENSMFWNDLGEASLIDSQFAGDTDAGLDHTRPDGGLPSAKIGNSNSIYVWSGGYGIDLGGSNGGTGATTASVSVCGNSSILGASDGNNYFGLAHFSAGSYSTPGLSVVQAYNIDKKVDDGLPQSGRVMAWYVPYPDDNGNVTVAWALGSPNPGNPSANPPPVGNLRVGASATSCYDNGSTLHKPYAYSIGYKNGANINCALSFQFQ